MNNVVAIQIVAIKQLKEKYEDLLERNRKLQAASEIFSRCVRTYFILLRRGWCTCIRTRVCMCVDIYTLHAYLCIQHTYSYMHAYSTSLHHFIVLLCRNKPPPSPLPPVPTNIPILEPRPPSMGRPNSSISGRPVAILNPAPKGTIISEEDGEKVILCLRIITFQCSLRAFYQPVLRTSLPPVSLLRIWPT